jgi:hypothetical protein
MHCRDCEFLSEPTYLREGDYPSVRCTLGLWDKRSKLEDRLIPQWHSYGECRLNRGPVRRFGESCTKGKEKVR